MISPIQNEQDCSGVHLWLILWKAARSLEKHSLQSVERFGLGLSDFGVLEALLHRGPLNAKELGAKVLLTSGSMTAAIDRLEKRGLVIRRNDRTDRRACIVHLTDTGKRFIQKIFEQHREAMESAVSEISIQDRSLLISLLKKTGKSAEAKLLSKQTPTSVRRSQS